MENHWNDDDQNWWNQQDLELREREEEERIEACNNKLAALKERIDESL